MKKIWQRKEKRKSLSTNYQQSPPPLPPPAMQSSALELESSSLYTNNLTRVASNMSGAMTFYDKDARDDASVRMPKSVPVPSASPKYDISQLITSSFDTKLIKNAWVNFSPNGSSSEEDLRLYRAELRGAILNLYKAPNSLNVRLFKLDAASVVDQNMALLTSLKGRHPSFSSDTGSTASTARDVATSSAASSSAVSNSAASISTRDSDATAVALPPNPAYGAASFAASITSDDVSIAGTILETVSLEETKIIYASTQGPHPDLQLDSEGTVVGGSVESIVHYILFAGDEVTDKVNHLIYLTPLFAQFDRFLKYFCLYGRMVSEASEGSSVNGATGNTSPAVNADAEVDTEEDPEALALVDAPAKTSAASRMISRLTTLVKNLNDNFFGLMLNPEHFNMILELLEVISVFANIDELKKAIVMRQRLLHALTLGPLGEEEETVNPLLELNSTFFLKIDLFQFIGQINMIDLKFNTTWNQKIDKSLLIATNLAQYDYFKRNPLIFNNNTHIHYLARLLVHHLLVEKNTPDVKARILQKWIQLGCLLDKTGNMVSWLGIATVILSQPVLRLRKVWAHVEPQYVKILRHDWSPVVFELDRHILNNFKTLYHVIAPKGLGKNYSKRHVIPFFGDLIIYNEQFDVRKYDRNFKRIKYSFNRWADFLKNMTDTEESIQLNFNILKSYLEANILLLNLDLDKLLHIGEEPERPATPPGVATETVDSPATAVSSEPDTTAFDELVREETEKMAQSPSDPDLARSRDSGTPDEHIQRLLYKLLEVNYDLYNLERIMKLSLVAEPSLAEEYIRTERLPPSTSSNLLVLHTIETATPDERLPLFNNKYFRVELGEHDGRGNDPDAPPRSIVVNDTLTFGVDEVFGESEVEGESEPDEDGSSAAVAAVVSDASAASQGLASSQSLASPHATTSTLDPSLGAELDATLTGTRDDVADASSNYDALSFITHTSSVHTPEEAAAPRSYKLIPKYGSLDALVDLLVVDTRNYAQADVTLHADEFREVFLLNYTSFTSTNTLIALLTHRFARARAAASHLVREPHLAFPDWDADEEGDEEAAVATKAAALAIQTNILRALTVLVDRFYDNFVVDLNNKALMIELLKLVSDEVDHWKEAGVADLETLLGLSRQLKKNFIRKTYRPSDIPKVDELLLQTFRFNNNLVEVPLNRNLPSYKNIAKIEKFLNKFNNFIAFFYDNISLADWFEVSKIFEIEFQKNHLLSFSLQKQSTTEENLIVSNIFNYFSSVHDPAKNELLILKFPLIFKKLFKLYLKFMNYLLLQITDLTITVDERFQRMKTILIMTRVAKMKMREYKVSVPGVGPIPSFIESALTNTIYSPESRYFANFWVRSADLLKLGSGGTFDDLESMLPHIAPATLPNLDEKFLPCFGWVLENLLAMNRVSNFDPSRKLIHFGKRYLTYKFLQNFVVERAEPTEITHGFNDFEFLIRLSDHLINNKALRDFNAYEREKAQIFRAVIDAQYKILKADNGKRAVKQAKAPAPTQTKTAATVKRQSMAYKLNSTSRFKISGLFNKSRPFSLVPAFASSNTPERVVSPHELPNPHVHFDAKVKPAFTINLRSKRIFPVYILPCSFKIDLDTLNEKYFFQAPLEHEMHEWLKKLDYANRHWFFSRTLNFRVSQNLIFGVPLEIVCNRENLTVPIILEKVFNEIEFLGVKELGIYRISPSINELQYLRNEVDRLGDYNFHSNKKIDVHTLTGCVKLYLRELPDALITDDVIADLFAFRSTRCTDTAEKVAHYTEILTKLPFHNYNFLRRLIGHMSKISAHQEFNKMGSLNLSTVIGPAITEPSSSELVANIGSINPIVDELIGLYEYIFLGNEIPE
ncbi:hypothetical protein BABINDRAFT_163211 [Babjeviella inositovora NRRL Y-12698]|uniref:Rho-GAP domain-containing protein n=1 Tax=Babjeviella inositovora NRRL Y-12698 TaxID=984486 RepID=A0A1E3QK31_9ASCO|nr:uncharacterized protein BABINDRAFT_163211 [Babjeviella inositovora NRRL Y-12698]ODQ77824.1 hypothetical protein BABINDRAFT_163211 [Babjeviella inositovora NRRL Y-12698]